MVLNSRTTTDETQSPSGDEPEPVRRHNLALLFAQNSDCIGWLSIPDTQINYPVMYTPDNPQKYLRRNIDGGYSQSGVPPQTVSKNTPCLPLLPCRKRMHGTALSIQLMMRNLINRSPCSRANFCMIPASRLCTVSSFSPSPPATDREKTAD